MDPDLGELNLQAADDTELGLNERMERLAGWAHLRNLEFGGQGAK